MTTKTLSTIAAFAAFAALSTSASAATLAMATTPLNVRSGPGPQYDVIGVIPDNGHATVIGCIQGSLWCQVNYAGNRGWAYSRYLAMRSGGRTAVIAQDTMPTVTYERPRATVGTAVAPPTISGSLVEPHAPSAPLVITPPPRVRSYIVSHQSEPVYLNGEVVVGAGLPGEVALRPVPDYDYQYAYVNRVPVLVEPSTRTITYVYRR